MHGNIFVADVNNKYRIGQRPHILDTAECSLQFYLLAMNAEHLFFSQSLKSTIFFHLRDVFETFDRLLDCFEVRQHSTKPAVIDEGHAAANRLLANSLTRRTLRTHEQYLAVI